MSDQAEKPAKRGEAAWKEAKERVAERGIVLAGGGSLLKGLDARLREETGMPTSMADSPLTCVAIGAGQSLEEFDALSRSNGRSAVGARLSWT